MPVHGLFPELLIQMGLIGYIAWTSVHYGVFAAAKEDEAGDGMRRFVLRGGYATMVAMLLYFSLVELKKMVLAERFEVLPAMRCLFMVLGIVVMHLACLRRGAVGGGRRQQS